MICSIWPINLCICCIRLAVVVGGRSTAVPTTEAAVSVEDAVTVVGVVTVAGAVTVVGAAVTVTAATLVTGVLPLKLALESTAMEKKQQNN